MLQQRKMKFIKHTFATYAKLINNSLCYIYINWINTDSAHITYNTKQIQKL